MSLSEEAANSKPKKPLNAYFVFRAQKMVEYKGEDNKVERVKQDWENLDPRVKEKMDQKFAEEMEQYKIDLLLWEKKYNIEREEKTKSKPKNTKQSRVEKAMGKEKKEDTAKKENKRETERSQDRKSSKEDKKKDDRKTEGKKEDKKKQEKKQEKKEEKKQERKEQKKEEKGEKGEKGKSRSRPK